MVTNDFVKPHAVIDGDEECPISESGGLGVGRDPGIDRAGPDLGDLRV